MKVTMDSWGFMGIHNILALSMNPHESGSGFMCENKSPWIPMTLEFEYPCHRISTVVVHIKKGPYLLNIAAFKQVCDVFPLEISAIKCVLFYHLIIRVRVYAISKIVEDCRSPRPLWTEIQGQKSLAGSHILVLFARVPKRVPVLLC